MDNKTKLLIGLLTLVVAFYAGLFAWAVQRDQRQAQFVASCHGVAIADLEARGRCIAR